MITLARRNTLMASSVLVLAAACAGCGNGATPAEGHAATTAGHEASPAAADARPDGGAADPAPTVNEQSFLDELAALGFPTGMTAETTIEVGIGICRGIADGADTDTVLDRIRPLTSAIAAQSAERDAAEVGSAIVDASRTHLCT